MSESLMKYNLHQLLVKAMMQKIPLIVVEGADDRPFYLRIAEAEGKRVQVIPSELVKKTDGYYYTPGCEGVIEIVEHVQGDIQRNPVCYQIKRSEYNNVMIDVSWKTESEIEYIKNRLSVLG